MHPLSGANLATLADLLWSSRGIAPARLPQATIAVLAGIGRWPFTTWERFHVARRLRRAPPMAPPIFIIGHWRSGTTHMYNVLSKADFGYVPPLATGLPWDLFGLARIFRPMLERALPEHRFIDNVPVHPDSPQEDEIALANMIPLSFYHAIYFPRRFDHYFDAGLFFDGCSDKEIDDWKRRFVYFLNKMALHQGGRPLLIKNPVYTARVAMIRELFPDAKFILMTRNPYEVFASTRNFYVKLFAALALQRHDAVPIDDVILRTYTRMMDALLRDTADLPAEALVEVRYEALDRDPLGEVARVYETLGLPGFDAARPAFERYLTTTRSYQKNAYRHADADLATVDRHWSRFIERWDYQRPAAAAG